MHTSEHRKRWLFFKFQHWMWKWSHTCNHTLSLCVSSRSQMRVSSQFAGVVTACSLCVCRAVPISQTPSCTLWDRTAPASGEFTRLHLHPQSERDHAPLPRPCNCRIYRYLSNLSILPFCSTLADWCKLLQETFLKWVKLQWSYSLTDFFKYLAKQHLQDSFLD